MLAWFFFILLLILLLAAFPAYPYSRRWGYGPVLVIALVLILFVAMWMWGLLWWGEQ